MKNIKENNAICYKQREFGNLAKGDIFCLANSGENILWIKTGEATGIAFDDSLAGRFDSDKKVILITSIVYELEKN